MTCPKPTLENTRDSLDLLVEHLLNDPTIDVARLSQEVKERAAAILQAATPEREIRVIDGIPTVILPQFTPTQERAWAAAEQRAIALLRGEWRKILAA